MKTTYSKDYVLVYLKHHNNLEVVNVENLDEGHISQAFKLTTQDGKMFVLRISSNEGDYAADRYAASVFSTQLLVPAVIDVGRFDDDAFYCISEFARGTTTDKLTPSEFDSSLHDIHKVLANIYKFDISSTSGYGHIDTSTGNASYGTWLSAVMSGLEQSRMSKFKVHAENIGLNPKIIDKLYDQYTRNSKYVSEVRCLLHGDPANDNMLVENGCVTAVIDWAQAGYGDWVSDFSRLDFWYPSKYGDICEFAKKYKLDDENIAQRVALYMATNALWTIEWADKAKNKHISQWLRENVESKLA